MAGSIHCGDPEAFETVRALSVVSDQSHICSRVTVLGNVTRTTLDIVMAEKTTQRM